MRRAFRSVLIALTLALTVASGAWASFNISCVGNAWRPELSLDAAGQPQAGGIIVSPPTAGRISIWGGNPGQIWTVCVRQRAVGAGQWPAPVKLQVRRSSYGSGSAATIGDDVNGYQQLGLTDTPLFHGSGDVLGIAVQVMVTGVEPGMLSRDYASQIIFTVRP